MSFLPWVTSRVKTSSQLFRLGNSPLSAMGSVPTRPPVADISPPACHSTIHQAASPEMATAFNMMVEITSLTPRVTFSTPAAPE